jgi:hypothetical protein
VVRCSNQSRPVQLFSDLASPFPHRCNDIPRGFHVHAGRKVAHPFHCAAFRNITEHYEQA